MQSSICSFFRHPFKHLDKVSFIGIYISLFFQTLLGIILLNATISDYNFSNLPVFRKILFFILLLYVSYLFIISIFAIVKRFRFLKVPGWAMIFSFPFGFGIMKLASFFIPDDQNHKTDFTIKFGWYRKIVSILSFNAKGQILLALILSLFVFYLTPLLFILVTVSFWIPATLLGLDRFAKSFKKFSINAVILNIVLVLLFASMLLTVYKFQPQLNSQVPVNIEQAVHNNMQVKLQEVK